MKLLILLLACAAAAGCAAPAGPATTGAGADPLFWPAPPAKARIQYLYALRQPSDLNIKPSLGRKFMDALAGRKETGLVRPYAVAVDDQSICVADPGGKAVHLFDLEKKRHVEITRAGDLSLVSPVGVALGRGRVFVADSALGILFIFDFKGNLVGSVADLQRPTGLAFDPSGARLYVAETLAHRIVVFDPEGDRLFEFGGRGTEAGAFNFPSHISVASDRLLVNDTMNFQVKTFSLDGVELSAFGKHGDSSGQFSQPKGLAADSQGNIYVAGATIDRLQIFSDRGEFLLAFGGEGSEPGKFLMPAGVAIEDDRIYVADSYNGRVQVFRFLGGD